LVEHFVAGTTARTAASLCGVNRKPEAFSRRIVGSAMSRSEAVKTAFQDWSFEYARVMV
jgi:transposase-like protein